MERELKSISACVISFSQRLTHHHFPYDESGRDEVLSLIC